MRFVEYKGKKVFARYGLEIPRGIAVSTPEEARKAAQKLGGEVFVKAQVPIGGRGKAGGIKYAADPAEAEKRASEILGMDIKGYKVKEVYIEEKIDIAGEIYLGITLDRSAGMPVVILSAEGGIDIEEVARTKPEKVVRNHIDPLWGFHSYQLRQVAYKAGISEDLIGDIVKMGLKLYEIFIDNDAVLAEINPAVVTPERKLVCGDSKLEIDDNALFKHPDLAALNEGIEENTLEAEARAKGISFVELDGNIAVIGNGAGLVMGTLDSLSLEGGSAANFLDVGGGALASKVEDALEIALKLKNVKAVLINIFGGITRCDEVARGIVAALKRLKPSVPIIVRLAGNNEEEGRRILRESGLNIHIFESMRTAAINAVRFSREERI
ncbi:MAG TPA: ADP-forming succinate--CoA ligase subunit beta [Peptococcaceae bacterium]|nr:MAG: Succinyl-CoA ligase [ADP-forming] subunit beta [Clostridia bacterium 41_269]HBT20277.1 ADP-forming succinate--CoA ligase subunit beta [Peptococcaceae bacterium]